MIRRAMVAAWVVAVAGATRGGAFGQVQVQQTNPLDANPQLNSGGSNTPVPGYAPINGNNVVTGNVSGLKYFHTAPSAVIAGPNGSFTVVQSNNLGTFSPYEFQGPQGSANFFNFARQSSGGAQTNIGQTQAYYLPSTTVSTGQGSLYSAPYGNGFDSAISPRWAVSPATPYGSDLRNSGPLSAGIPLRQFPASPANPQADQGAGGNMASPLFGLRGSALTPGQGAPDTLGATPGSGQGTPTNGNGVKNGTQKSGDDGTVNPNDPPNNSNDASNGLSAEARVKGRVPNGAGVGNGTGDDGSGQPTGAVSGTYRTLLQRLQDAQKQAERDGRNGTASDHTGASDATATAGNTGRNGANGTNGANGASGGTDQATARNGSTGTPGDAGTKGAGVPGQGGGVTGRPALDPLTGRPVAPGARGTAAVGRGGTGFVPGAGRGDGNDGAGGTGSGLTPDASGSGGTSGTAGAGGAQRKMFSEGGTDRSTGGSAVRSGAMARTGLEELPAGRLQAGRDVPALKSLVEVPRGGTVTPFDTLMTQAEVLLKGGKYLQAADAYQTAITTEPDNALAVIGRAQAELGAGMYQSAANDLQFVFTKKPELMGVHYPVGDYLPAERQNYLIKDLQGLSTNRGPGNTASFLLCYMFYNTGRSEDAQAELGRWGNRAWRDAWQGVAGKAWGK